jgi:hypothetical protein
MMTALDFFEFTPNDLLAVEIQGLPEAGADITVDVVIESASPSDFRPKIFASNHKNPVPASDNALPGSLDFDFAALLAANEKIIALNFTITDPTTTFRPMMGPSFTTNKDSKRAIFLIHSDEKSAKLWIKVKRAARKKEISYNMHFITINPHDKKPIEWAFDPKVRNEG